PHWFGTTSCDTLYTLFFFHPNILVIVSLNEHSCLALDIVGQPTSRLQGRGFLRRLLQAPKPSNKACLRQKFSPWGLTNSIALKTGMSSTLGVAKGRAFAIDINGLNGERDRTGIQPVSSLKTQITCTKDGVPMQGKTGSGSVCNVPPLAHVERPYQS